MRAGAAAGAETGATVTAAALLPDAVCSAAGRTAAVAIQASHWALNKHLLKHSARSPGPWAHLSGSSEQRMARPKEPLALDRKRPAGGGRATASSAAPLPKPLPEQLRLRQRAAGSPDGCVQSRDAPPAAACSPARAALTGRRVQVASNEIAQRRAQQRLEGGQATAPLRPARGGLRAAAGAGVLS